MDASNQEKASLPEEKMSLPEEKTSLPEQKKKQRKKRTVKPKKPTYAYASDYLDTIAIIVSIASIITIITTSLLACITVRYSEYNDFRIAIHRQNQDNRYVIEQLVTQVNLLIDNIPKKYDLEWCHEPEPEGQKHRVIRDYCKPREIKIYDKIDITLPPRNNVTLNNSNTKEFELVQSRLNEIKRLILDTNKEFKEDIFDTKQEVLDIYDTIVDISDRLSAEHKNLSNKIDSLKNPEEKKKRFTKLNEEIPSDVYEDVDPNEIFKYDCSWCRKIYESGGFQIACNHKYCPMEGLGN
jgi:hypothetical protein